MHPGLLRGYFTMRTYTNCRTAVWPRQQWRSYLTNGEAFCSSPHHSILYVARDGWNAVLILHPVIRGK
jgi:hypothetical protein